MRPALASRGRGRAHRVFHPLCGATLDTLVPALLRGGVSPGRAHVAAIATAIALLRLPFTLSEAAISAMRGDARRPYPAPVFIVGHWRSGTTHLTNVLSRSAAFGILSPLAVGLPAEALGLGRIAAPFIEQFFPTTRLIDEVALTPDLPQEDELAMANLSTLSCNHGIYFPSRIIAEFERGVFGDLVSARERAVWARRLERYVAKMTRAAGDRPLLIRNPANSARIPLLRAIWPEARFIHIHRDPADVYASSIAMFAILVRELSLGRAAVDTRSLVRQVYPRLMRRLIEDGTALPAGSYAEIGYRAFIDDPMPALARLHDELGLPGFDAGRVPMRDYLAGCRQTPRRHALEASDGSWLASHGADIFAHWNYATPDAAQTKQLAHSSVAVPSATNASREGSRSRSDAMASAMISRPTGT